MTGALRTRRKGIQTTGATGMGDAIGVFGILTGAGLSSATIRNRERGMIMIAAAIAGGTSMKSAANGAIAMMIDSARTVET